MYYYYEYNKNRDLIKFIESSEKREYSGITISNSNLYCSINGKLFEKFEEKGLYKTVSKYKDFIKMHQIFRDGEVWVKVFKKNDYNKDLNFKLTNQCDYIFPNSVVSLENNKISHLKFDIKESFVRYTFILYEANNSSNSP